MTRQAACARMRRLALLMCALLLPVAGAAEPYVTVVDWASGRFVAGTRVGVEGVDLARFPLTIDACRRILLVDLLFSPEGSTLAVPGVGAATILYEFRAEVYDADGALRASQRLRASGYGTPVGQLPTAGAYELRLILVTGVDVEWQFRARAREVFGDIECLPRLLVNEVESNPGGPDAGAEWVELYNPRDVAVDASHWTLRWGTEGAVTLPEGTTVAPGGHLVVVLPSPVPDESATLTLEAAFGYVSDETPALSDHADDGQTLQRSPDGASSWAFAIGTPAAPNA